MDSWTDPSSFCPDNTRNNGGDVRARWGGPPSSDFKDGLAFRCERDDSIVVPQDELGDHVLDEFSDTLFGHLAEGRDIYNRIPHCDLPTPRSWKDPTPSVVEPECDTGTVELVPAQRILVAKVQLTLPLEKPFVFRCQEQTVASRI
ncbi:MAG: hypothetical protein R3C11_24740 [Planctomycetaceae bacterium]